MRSRVEGLPEAVAAEGLRLSAVPGPALPTGGQQEFRAQAGLSSPVAIGEHALVLSHATHAGPSNTKR